MLDDKGRLFGKVSLVDLFAVVVVAAVFYVVYTFTSADERHEAGEERYVTLTFFTPLVHGFTARAVETGVPVIDDDGAIFLGHVTGTEIGEGVRFLPDRLGNEVASSIEGYNSLKIRTRVRAPMTHGAVLLGGNVYAVGSEAHIWAGNVRVVVHISDITEG
jgi:hypothetical protein